MVNETELDFSRDRNASLKLISWFEIERVRNARVLVVGAGAIGNEVLKNLALMGVGTIHIVDLDTVEISNLSRSVLYRASDAGQSKAEASAKALRELNPDCTVAWHHGDLEADLGEGFLRRFDVVLGCLDSVYARYVLNRRCLRAQVPWIDSGIATLDGQVQVMHPDEGPCYECGFGEAQYEVALGRIRNSCLAISAEARRQGRSPTTVTIASIVAGIQVQECLKLLDPEAWRGRNLVGRKLEFSGTHASVDIFGVNPRDDCPAHAMVLDWADDPPLALVGASAMMPVADFLDLARDTLGAAYFLSLDSEFISGYVCPTCGAARSELVAVHKAIGQRLRCSGCGWMPGFQSDVGTINRVSPRDARERFAGVPLSAFDIPLGGVVEMHGPARTVRHVLLAADLAAWNTFWHIDGSLAALAARVPTTNSSVESRSE